MKKKRLKRGKVTKMQTMTKKQAEIALMEQMRISQMVFAKKVSSKGLTENDVMEATRKALEHVRSSRRSRSR